MPEAGADVLEALAAAVLAVPGVARLEPTLENAGARILWSTRVGDGIHVLLRAGLAEVDVDLSVRRGHQARRTAAEVRRTVQSTLDALALRPGTVTVNVLAIVDDPS